MTAISSTLPLRLTVAQSFEILDERVHSTASKYAMRSVVLSAVRYQRALAELSVDRASILQSNIAPLLPTLHLLARDDAATKDLTAPTEASSRVARFVELVSGCRPNSPRLRQPCPARFSALLAVRPEKHAQALFAYVNNLCKMVGHEDAPRTFPPIDVLLDAAMKLHHTNAQHDGHSRVSNPRKRLYDALTAYRSRRELLISQAGDDARAELRSLYAPMPKFRNRHRACHLGTLNHVQEYLRSKGLEPETMTPLEVLQASCPRLAEDLVHWAASPTGAALSSSRREQIGAALTRITAWLWRAGLGDKVLQLSGLDDLLAEMIDSAGPVRINHGAAKRIGAASATIVPKVTLLEFAINSEANAALSRSTVTTLEGAGVTPDGQPWYTDAMLKDVDCYWSITKASYEAVEESDEEYATRWAKLSLRYEKLWARMEARHLPGERKLTGKDKLRLLRMVTLPQLMCVGLPMRRREIRALRDDWLDAKRRVADAGHQDLDAHPAVKEAEARYFRAAVPFTLLGIAADDGMRLKQYTQGCLGASRHFNPTLVLDKNGNAIGIQTVHTTFTGAPLDPAVVKVRTVDDRTALRPDRELGPGAYDKDVLWDILTTWRPKQLERCGAIASAAEYRLMDDIEAGQFALFPSSSRKVRRANRSRTDISHLIGRELHYVVRKFLRPSLEAWDNVGPEWRGLWAAHVTRLLIGTYWAGVCKLWDHASYLTMDCKRTLEKKYVVVDKQNIDKVGLDRTNWEHPNAYDGVMDRLCRAREDFDPLEIPGLPLPPHLRLAPVSVLHPPKIRVRRTRLGQRAPRALPTAA